MKKLTIQKHITQYITQKLSLRKTPLFLLITFLIMIAGCSGQDQSMTETLLPKATGDLTIIAATDMHYLSERLHDNGAAITKFVEEGDSKQLVYSDVLMRALTYQVGQKKADIVLFSGDLTNNGEKLSHIDLAKRMYEMEQEGVSVLVVPGNHDVDNPWARGFKGEKQYVTDSVGPEEFRRIYGEFGYDEAISVDKTTLSYLAAPSDKLWLLMLDSPQYGENKEIGYPQLGGYLYEESLKWIEECGRKAADSGASLIAVMHHNLMDHNRMMSAGFTIGNSEEVMVALRKSGVNLVLTGHIHSQNIAVQGQDSDTPLYDIAGGAFSLYPFLYGNLHFSASDRTLSYKAETLDVDSWARSEGVTDPKLLNFQSQTAEYVASITKDRYLKRMSSSNDFDNYNDDELSEMADMIARLNLNYMSGSESKQKKKLLASQGYKLWAESPEGTSLKSFVMRLADDQSGEHLSLQVKLPVVK